MDKTRTPQKINKSAKRIGILGFSIAIGVLLILMIPYLQNKKLEEKQSQIQQIELINVYVGKGLRLGKQTYGVFGTLINHSLQTVALIQVMIEFLDVNGAVVGTTDFFPVSQFSFEDPKPLEPKGRKEFGFAMEKEAPPTWSKEVKLTVVDVQFKN